MNTGVLAAGELAATTVTVLVPIPVTSVTTNGAVTS